jgi:putative intracellular protease/amidase
MRERHVVIVAFDGVQPLDAVGPHEVFVGAGQAAAALGRAGGYRVTLASPGWSDPGQGAEPRTSPLSDVTDPPQPGEARVTR